MFTLRRCTPGPFRRFEKGHNVHPANLFLIWMGKKSSAVERFPDPHPAVGKPEHFGHVPEILDCLGTNADVDHPIFVKPGHPLFGLEMGVFSKRGPVGVFNDDGRLGKSLGHVTLGDIPLCNDVPFHFHTRGAGGHGGHRIEHRRQLLIVHQNSFAGLSRGLTRLGRVEDDPLAEEASPFWGKNRKVETMLMAAAQGAAAVGARQPERKRKASRGNFTGERAYPSQRPASHPKYRMPILHLRPARGLESVPRVVIARRFGFWIGRG